MRNPDKYPVLVSGSFSFLVIPYHLYKKRGGWGGIDRSLFFFFLLTVTLLNSGTKNAFGTFSSPAHGCGHLPWKLIFLLKKGASGKRHNRRGFAA